MATNSHYTEKGVVESSDSTSNSMVFFSNDDFEDLYYNSQFYNIYFSMIVNNASDVCAKVALLNVKSEKHEDIQVYNHNDEVVSMKDIALHDDVTIIEQDCDITLKHSEALERLKELRGGSEEGRGSSYRSSYDYSYGGGYGGFQGHRDYYSSGSINPMDSTVRALPYDPDLLNKHLIATNGRILTPSQKKYGKEIYRDYIIDCINLILEEKHEKENEKGEFEPMHFQFAVSVYTYLEELFKEDVESYNSILDMMVDKDSLEYYLVTTLGMPVFKTKPDAFPNFLDLIGSYMINIIYAWDTFEPLKPKYEEWTQ